MESKARLIDVAVNYLTKRFKLTFEVDADIEHELDSMMDKDLRLIAKKWSDRRSLNANAYFHVLVGKIADAMTISKARCKNIMITRYGQVEFVDETPAIIKTNIPYDSMMELETLHAIPVKYDAAATFYKLYRGSHTYDSMEMSKLIDGTVEEAKALGIETLTPQELERMKQAWQPKEA